MPVRGLLVALVACAPVALSAEDVPDALFLRPPTGGVEAPPRTTLFLRPPAMTTARPEVREAELEALPSSAGGTARTTDASVETAPSEIPPNAEDAVLLPEIAPLPDGDAPSLAAEEPAAPEIAAIVAPVPPAEPGDESAEGDVPAIRGFVWGPDLPDVHPPERPDQADVRRPGPDDLRPLARDSDIPRTRWENRSRGLLWTRVAMSAVKNHGRPLIETVPDDIADWCPAYPGQTDENRAAFWVGLLSTLTRYESTFDPRAVGGGGLWYGLMQILPTTAEFRNCRVTSGEGLKHGPSNLSCAVRIMATTVPRDNAISIRGESRWQGVAADWGPMTTGWMRRDMQRYTRRQVYCRPLGSVRPKERPAIDTFAAD